MKVCSPLSSYIPLLPHCTETDGQSYSGYTGLKGKIQTVTVTKVSRKLGIAVEGGATTKNQKGVVIRQITVSPSVYCYHVTYEYSLLA